MFFKFASICTSGGVFEQGLPNCIKPIWGVEIDPLVAEVYKLNYPDSQIFVQDACTVDWKKLERPDFLLACPSCRSFSQLNNKVEAAKDIAVTQAVARAIAHFLPQVFTLENVTAYKDSESWTVIKNALEYLGYSISAKVERMRFWGVPQKQRNRFIAIATLNHGSILLMPTNRTNYWYECIQDLIPGLKPSPGLTGTQEKYLSDKTKRAIANGETVLLKRNQIWSSTGCAYQSEPYCWTPTATLATDQRKGNRPLFADLVTPNGILSLNPRCLARIQTIPDSYILPDNVAIACLVAGDAVPPLFVKQMWEQILNSLSSQSQLTTTADDTVDQLFPKTTKSADSFKDTIVSLKSSGFINKREKLETIIDSRVENLKDFYTVGSALIEIKSDELYKPDFKNFYSYCSDRFSLSQPRIKQLIRAVKVKDSVRDVVKKFEIDLVEGQCRELNKIKDISRRSQVLKFLINSGDKITAKNIQSASYKLYKTKSQSTMPVELPALGTIIRITCDRDAELKPYYQYWGVVVKQHEFTVNVDTAIGLVKAVHPRDFQILEQFDDAVDLLGNLKYLLFLEDFPEIKPFANAIATSPDPKLSEQGEKLIKFLLKQK